MGPSKKRVLCNNYFQQLNYSQKENISLVLIFIETVTKLYEFLKRQHGHLGGCGWVCSAARFKVGLLSAFSQPKGKYFYVVLVLPSQDASQASCPFFDGKLPIHIAPMVMKVVTTSVATQQTDNRTKVIHSPHRSEFWRTMFHGFFFKRKKSYDREGQFYY